MSERVIGRLLAMVLTVVSAGRLLLVYSERWNCTFIMKVLGLSALVVWCLLRRWCNTLTVLVVEWVPTRLSWFSAPVYRAKRAR